MTFEPKRCLKKCPACGALVSLNDRGQYAEHTMPPAAASGWRVRCKQSGRQAVIPTRPHPWSRR